MKRYYYLILLICISIITLNCQKEINYSGPEVPGTGNTNADPITATLQGNIVDENNQPVANATIKVGQKTVNTDARGHFRIIKASLDKKASLIAVEKQGYFKAFRTFSATSGANRAVIKLIKKASVGSVNAAAGGTVALSNGSKIALPANGIVRAAGGAYTGNINVYAAYIDPTSADISKIVPGSFLADDKDGNKVILTSYGMLAVELESSAGEKLQIAAGNTATLTTAIPASLLASAPSTISLWYVDEQTGIWKEEGKATKNGTNYIGEVNHFTYWNCDVPGPVINLTASFKNLKGSPLTNAEIRFRPATGYATAHGFTDSLGQISGPVPANTNLILEVMSPCYTVMYSKNIGPFSSDVNIGTITANDHPSIVTVQGRLLNCNGAPVTNGHAIINYDNKISYVSVQNANGDFSAIFYTCSGMPATCEILGVDADAQQQGVSVNVSVVSPTTVAGNVTACGTSALQYINYNLDGVNQSFSSLVPGDQFTANAFDSTGTSKGANISGYNAIEQIFFQFGDSGNGSTYQLNYLTIKTSGVTTLVQPFTTTIIRYAESVGEFFEGSFSGQYKDALNVSHTISCSFRVRKL